MAFELARLTGLPMTGGSDAHEGRAVGYAVTHLKCTATNAADVIEMILGGQSEVLVREQRRKRQWDRTGAQIGR